MRIRVIICSTRIATLPKPRVQNSKSKQSGNLCNISCNKNSRFSDSFTSLATLSCVRVHIEINAYQRLALSAAKKTFLIQSILQVDKSCMIALILLFCGTAISDCSELSLNTFITFSLSVKNEKFVIIESQDGAVRLHLRFYFKFLYIVMAFCVSGALMNGCLPYLSTKFFTQNWVSVS